MAKPLLVEAKALKPMRCRCRALPTSHGLGRTKKPSSCRRRNAARFSAAVGMARRPLDRWRSSHSIRSRPNLAVSGPFSGVAGGGRLDGDALAAAASVCLVRIVKHELGRELGGLEIDLRAEQEQDRLGFDQDADALVLDD